MIPTDIQKIYTTLLKYRGGAQVQREGNTIFVWLFVNNMVRRSTRLSKERRLAGQDPIILEPR